MRLLYVRIPDFEDIPGGGGNISYLQLIENEAAARLAGDEELNQQLDIIIDGLADFENEINADLATVQTLAETNQLNISTKTDQADFDSLAEIVTDNGLLLASRASQSDLDNLATEVSTKATPSDISAAIAALVDGAPASLDTLAEIAAALAGDEASINDLLIQINTKVRFDAAQSLTTAQQLQARQNISAEAAGVAAALVAAITAASIGAATAAQGSKADSALQSGDVAPVALSGSYAALLDKPTIPAAQVNADWASNSGLSQILNKPTLFGLSSLLTGLGTGSATAIAAADTLLAALEKLQAQITTNAANIAANATALAPVHLRMGLKWYLPSTWYDGEYPFASGVTAGVLMRNRIYLLPRKILENTTIQALGIYCSTGVSGAVAYLGVYTDNNGVPNSLIASGSVACSTTGTKSVSVSANFIEGQIVWDAVVMTVADAQIYKWLPSRALNVQTTNNLSSNPVVVYVLDSQTDLPATLPALGTIPMALLPRMSMQHA